MVKAFAASLGELTVHLLGEGEVVLRGPARWGVVDDRLPDPGPFADFGRGVDARLELPVGEEPVEDLGARRVASRLAPGDARPQDPEVGGREPQRVAYPPHGVDGEGGPPHDRAVELDRDHHHARRGGGDVGVDRQPLHHRRAVDDGDVVVPRRVGERELERLLVEQELVLVDQVDDRGDHREPLDVRPEG